MDDRDLLLERTNIWLEPGALKRCRRILKGLQPRGAGGEVYLRESHRLILVVSGTGRFVGIDGGEDFDLNLEAGDAIYFGPRSYVCPKPRVGYQSIGFLFQPSTNLAKISLTSRELKKGAVTLTYLAQWEVLEKANLRLGFLFRLLDEPAPASLGEDYARKLFELLIGEARELLLESAVETSGQGSYLWERACNYLAEHWADARVSRESAAGHLGIHPNHLSRIFRTNGKKTFRAHLNEIRLLHSLDLLEDSGSNVTEIAAMCGYSDLQYFIRRFRERFGSTPGRFRNEHRGRRRRASERR